MAEEQNKEPVEPSTDHEPQELQILTDEQKKAQNLSYNRSWLYRFKKWYKTHKKLSIPLTIILLLVVLAAVPWTRYHTAGLVLKNDVQLKVTDATANTPVSGAAVSIGSLSAVTDSEGIATLKNVAVGNHTATVTKKYYEQRQTSIFVPLTNQKSVPEIEFTATGRQAKVIVKNLISQKPLSDVDVKMAGTSAKTDDNGEAIVVIPADSKEEEATLNLKGYNEAKVKVQASSSDIKENILTLTPSGKIYFLSKLSGRIDVIKTNLDGTDRKKVLAGTGKEEDRGTVLLASRDWEYLALLSRREGDNAKLYLIKTGDDSLTEIDGGNASFTPVGWSDHHFIYQVTRLEHPQWQPRGESIKSYNADSGELLSLDQTRAEGSGQSNYAYESYASVYEVDGNVVYEKLWEAHYNHEERLINKQAGIYSINADGTNPKTLKSFSYSNGVYLYIDSIPYEANEIYYAVGRDDKNTYYQYTSGQLTLNKDVAKTFDEYYETYDITTYLASPSGKETFWTEERDGKNTLFIGDSAGKNGKQIAKLSEYLNYGWYTDDYILVSKDSSELYIAPKAGMDKDSEAVKISDYHKPKQNFFGYGGGYGGI